MTKGTLATTSSQEDQQLDYAYLATEPVRMGDDPIISLPRWYGQSIEGYAAAAWLPGKD